MIRKLTHYILTALFMGGLTSAYAVDWGDWSTYQVTAGAEGGLSLACEEVTTPSPTTPPTFTRMKFFGQYGLIGGRFSIDKTMEEKWTAGVIGSIRYFMGGSTDQRNGGTGAQSIKYNIQPRYRYELYLSGGRWVNENQRVYLKAGVLLSQFNVRVYECTFSRQKKSYDLGLGVGAGYEVPYNDKLIFGGVLEYARFRTLCGALSNPYGPSGTYYRINPSSYNLVFTASYKFH